MRATDIKAIREGFKSGIKLTELAEEYGVSRATAGRVVRQGLATHLDVSSRPYGVRANEPKEKTDPVEDKWWVWTRAEREGLNRAFEKATGLTAQQRRKLFARRFVKCWMTLGIIACCSVSAHSENTPQDAIQRGFSMTPGQRTYHWAIPSFGGPKYPWKTCNATLFFVGESARSGGGTDNRHSAYDRNWMANFGGCDNPQRRVGYFPRDFTPKMSPFYASLPVMDLNPDGTLRPEAKAYIPWYHEVPVGESLICGHWIEIRYGSRRCFAEIRDCGPWKKDSWKFVFGNDPPAWNPNGSAGLDVSPAVHQYLGITDGISMCSWRFVSDGQVPDGPWRMKNNPQMEARR